MKALLMAFGTPEYHAACLSPFLWTILILAAVYLIAGAAYDASRRRAIERARRARRQAQQQAQKRARQQRGGGCDQDQRRCG